MCGNTSSALASVLRLRRPAACLPASTLAHPKLSSVTYIDNTHIIRLVAQSPVSLLNKDRK